MLDRPVVTPKVLKPMEDAQIPSRGHMLNRARFTGGNGHYADLCGSQVLLELEAGRCGEASRQRKHAEL